MASPVTAPTTFLPSVSPSALGGNASVYQEKMNGGQGYGYEGKEIAPGRMEFASYKGGRKSKRQNKSKKSKKQNKSKRRMSRR